MEAHVFPPKKPEDIYAYDLSEIVKGYSDYDVNLEAGLNRSKSYRWGYQNAKRDTMSQDDGFDDLRHRYIKWKRNLPNDMSRIHNALAALNGEG